MSDMSLYGERLHRKTSDRAHEYVPRRWRHRATNYELGIIAQATVAHADGNGRVRLRLTHYNSTVGYVIWFGRLSASAVVVQTNQVTLTHHDPASRNTHNLSVTIARRDWEKFLTKAEKTEAGSAAKALECVDLTVDHDPENGSLKKAPVAGPDPTPLPPAEPCPDLVGAGAYASEKAVAA